MIIKNILTQNRRDFTAIMKCEFCDYETQEDNGYDDRYFHDEVIPEMECKGCGKSTKSEGGTIAHTETKYPDNLQV